MIPAFLFQLLAFLAILVAATEFNENEKDAYYKWFGFTRESFNKEANSNDPKRREDVKNKLSSAYRKVARQYHPDKNKSEDATATFNKISQAFSVLNDDKKRPRYDRGGAKAVADDSAGGEHAGSANDFFSRMFNDMFDMDDFFGGGGGGGGPNRGPGSQTDLTVTLEDVFTGRSMVVEYSRVKLCNRCRGSGADDPKEVKKCNRCKGMGAYITIQQIVPGFVQQMQVRCQDCEGRGSTFKKACGACSGHRVGREQEKIDVVIPPGAKDGEQFRFREMADENPDRRTGDLVVVIRTEEHPVYQRDGIHLYATVDLTVRESLLGFKKHLKQLDGKLYEFSRKEVTQNDFVERHAGQGMPRKDSNKRGDLFIKYRVIMPPKITRDQQILLEKVFPLPLKTHDEL